MGWDRERIHEVFKSGAENGAGTARETTTYIHMGGKGRTVEHSISAVNPSSLNTEQAEAIRQANEHLKQGRHASAALVLKQAHVNTGLVSKASLLTETSSKRATEKLEHSVSKHRNLLNIASQGAVTSPEGGISSAYYSPNGGGRVRKVEEQRRANTLATVVERPAPAIGTGLVGLIKHALIRPQRETLHLKGEIRERADLDAVDQLNERDDRRNFAALVEAAEIAIVHEKMAQQASERDINKMGYEYM